MKKIALEDVHNQRSITVGIAEWRLSSDPNAVVVTHSLGSCVGVAIYDIRLCMGGIGHFMAPSSRANPDKARTSPGMYVDTGISGMLQEFFDAGSRRGDLMIKVAGGARMMDARDHFRIGHKNLTVLRKLMWKNSLMIHAEDTGGVAPRTLFLDISNGETTIRSAGTKRSL